MNQNIKYKTTLFLAISISMLTTCAEIKEQADEKQKLFTEKAEALNSRINQEIKKVGHLDSLATRELNKINKLDSIIEKNATRVDSLLSK